MITNLSNRLDFVMINLREATFCTNINQVGCIQSVNRVLLIYVQSMGEVEHVAKSGRISQPEHIIKLGEGAG